MNSEWFGDDDIYMIYLANYSDLSQGHPTMWFSRGILPKSVKFKFKNYGNLPRYM